MSCRASAFVFCLVVLAGCGSMPPFQDQDIVDRVGESSVLACTSADTIRSYKIDSKYSEDSGGNPTLDWSLDSFSEMYPVALVGRELLSSQRLRLLAILGSSSSYVLDAMEPSGHDNVVPEYCFEFKGLHGTQYVLVNLRYRKVTFRDENGRGASLVLQGGLGEFERLIGGLFAPELEIIVHDV